MDITYFEIIGSLRKHIEEVTGVKTIWRYYGYIKPEEESYVEIEYVNSNLTEVTKTKELIDEDVFLNIGVHGGGLTQLSRNHKAIMSILQYGSIPLYNDSFKQIGTFSIESINGVSNIMTGTHSENLTDTHRLYIDVAIPIAHVKMKL